MTEQGKKTLKKNHFRIPEMTEKRMCLNCIYGVGVDIEPPPCYCRNNNMPNVAIEPFYLCDLWEKINE